jgi:hypothetical protein
MGDISKEVANTLLPPKIYKKKLFIAEIEAKTAK